MKHINTFNIFQAAYFLTEPDNKLVKLTLEENGLVHYHLLCSDNAGAMQEAFACGSAHVNLQVYIWKVQELYWKSSKLRDDESLLMQGGEV